MELLNTGAMPLPIVPTLVGDANTIPPIASIPVRTVSTAEKQLRLALRIASLHHTYSMAQLIGVYPA
jgi:hypothetical protein